MSTINSQDQELITQLKKKLEEVSGLPSPENWKQKDYDFLVFFIEEKSGIRISLSTLKRLWKNENNRLPHIATLDALSQVAYNKKWLSIKAELVPKVNLNSNESRRKQYRLLPVIVGVLLLFILSFLGFKHFNTKTEKVNLNIENVYFSARTSVDNKVPNSVVFTYDVSTIEAEKFYIQQDWDPRRRVEIFKKNKTQTDIYYEPGLYNTKLIADTIVLEEIPVHITTDDWFLMSMNGEEKRYYDKSQRLTNGTLGLSIKLGLTQKIKKNEQFGLALYNSREFNTDGDNFSYSSSFKMDSISAIHCPIMAIIIKGEHDYFVIQILNKGCESEAYIKLSEKQISGKNNDLTMLGAEVYEWQNIKVSVENKTLTLNLNGKEIYKNDYKEPIGSLKEITHMFNGWGVIDDVELSDVNNNITFADSFD